VAGKDRCNMQRTGEGQNGAFRKTVSKNDLALGPHQIIRKSEGYRYFGYKHTTLDEKIKSGEIPKPIHLGKRARGWTGQQILDWQRRLIENSK
jgi:predicted DNA-binding transcriptional regulator AlpA